MDVTEEKVAKKSNKTPTTSKSISERVGKNTTIPVRASKRQALTK